MIRRIYMNRHDTFNIVVGEEVEFFFQVNSKGKPLLKKSKIFRTASEEKKLEENIYPDVARPSWMKKTKK